MKKALCVAFLLLSTLNTAWATQIDKYLSGTWWNPSQSGHGFNFQVADKNLTLLFWYVYHPDGTPMFLLGVGDIVGSDTQGTVYYNSGMKFGEFDPADIKEEVWGTFSIRFDACDEATLEYASTMSHMGVPYGSGSIPIQRFVSIDEMPCSDNRNAGLYQGNFYSEETGEVIPGMAVLAPNGDFVALSYGGTASFGTYLASSGSLSGNGSAYSAGEMPPSQVKAEFSMFGSINPDHRLVVNYGISEGDAGWADLYATVAQYRRGASLQALADTYAGINLLTGVEGTTTILPDGSISGSNTLGCSFTGHLTAPDPRFNLLELNYTSSGCGAGSQPFSGYAVVDDGFELGDGRMLLLLASDGSRANVIALLR